jgi:hypothetical protein
MPEASKLIIHGYIHGKWLTELTIPKVLKKIRALYMIHESTISDLSAMEPGKKGSFSQY